MAHRDAVGDRDRRNSRGVPAAEATPFLTACAWRDSAMLHGGGLVPGGRDPDQRLVDLLGRQPHRIEEGAVRRAFRPDRDMPARRRDLSMAGRGNRRAWPNSSAGRESGFAAP